LQDAKKAAKKDVKQQLKALSLSHEPPAYVADDDCDGILRAFGMPVSKLTPLHVEWDGRVVNKSESFFSKTKAAHRCDQPLTAAPAQHWRPAEHLKPARFSSPASCRMSRLLRGVAMRSTR